MIEYRSPAPIVAFVLAFVSGALLSVGEYVGGAIVGGLAVLVLGLWLFAEDRGDDDRHTLW